MTTAEPSGVDKRNGFRHAGDALTINWANKYNVFSTGAWNDWAYTGRYQTPSNILMRQNTPLGNFHEHFIAQSILIGPANGALVVSSNDPLNRNRIVGLTGSGVGGPVP